MLLKEIELFSYRLPFSAPVALPGGILTHREGMLVAVRAGDGQIAWGEASPLPGFSNELLDSVADRAHGLAAELRGKPLGQVRRYLGPGKAIPPSLYFALQSALDALAARETGLLVHEFLHPGAPDMVRLCRLLDGDAATRIDGVRQAVASGCLVVKLKVGRGTLETDIDVVGEITGLLPPGSRLRLDANRAWILDDALQFCRALPPACVEYLEEPVKDYRQIPVIQDATGIACAVDETLQQLGRCAELKAAGTSDPEENELRSVVERAGALVWKPSLCLPPRLLNINTRAPLVLSGAYESGVGTAAILSYAAALSGRNVAAGVDTYSRLASDVLDVPLSLSCSEVSLVVMEQARATVQTARLKRL